MAKTVFGHKCVFFDVTKDTANSLKPSCVLTPHCFTCFSHPMVPLSHSPSLSELARELRWSVHTILETSFIIFVAWFQDVRVPPLSQHIWVAPKNHQEAKPLCLCVHKQRAKSFFGGGLLLSHQLCWNAGIQLEWPKNDFSIHIETHSGRGEMLTCSRALQSLLEGS